jgi:hypothetical protein
LSRLLVGLALLAAVLLVVSEFLPLYEVVIGQLETETRSENGGGNHAYAMLLLGLAVVPMALGALRGAKPAMLALAAIGVIVLVIALTVDLPAARQEGTLRESITYENAKAQPAIGFFLETLAGVLLLLSGGLQFLRAREGDRREAPPEPQPDARDRD